MRGGMMTAAGLAAIGLAASANAASFNTLTFDVNAIDLSFGGTLSETFTGTWTFGTKAATKLANVYDPYSGSDAGVATLTGFSGSLSFNNGFVTGGSFTLSVSAAGGGTDTLSGTLTPGSPAEQLNTDDGVLYTVEGLVINASFTDADSDSFFGGDGPGGDDDIDITDFLAQNLFNGSFVSLNANKNTGNGNMDITVMVPVPATAGLAMLGCVGVAARRRRAL